MRGKVAKRLRRAIYGEDFSPREREYEWLTCEVHHAFNHNGKSKLSVPPTTKYQLVNRGRRASYQQLKKVVRHGR